MKGVFILGGSYLRVPGTFTETNPVTRDPTSQPLKNTYERIHWTARERMSEKYGDYEKAGLKGFTMKSVVTEPDSPFVHDAEDIAHLPLPQGADRHNAVQWINEALHVSLMEDEMRTFEQKILQLWDMQDLYAMTVDKAKGDSVAGEVGPEDMSAEAPERLQKLLDDGKRATVDVSAQTPVLKPIAESRRETA